jgi:hypothetical protein
MPVAHVDKEEQYRINKVRTLPGKWHRQFSVIDFGMLMPLVQVSTVLHI